MVEGPIGAGKTTLVTKVAASFEHARAVHEHVPSALLEAFYNDGKRYGFALQLLQYGYRRATLAAATASRGTNDLVVLDRSILGDRAFALWNAAVGHLTAEDWALYCETTGANVAEALARAGADATNTAILYLHDPTETCSARQQRRDTGDIDVAYMDGIAAAYLVVLACVPSQFSVAMRRWNEYADTASIYALARPTPKRRAALRDLAQEAIYRLTVTSRTRDFLRAELARVPNATDP